MPSNLWVHAARLDLNDSDDVEAEVKVNLSGVALSGDWLWVVGDEGSSINRLEKLPTKGKEKVRWGHSVAFALTDLLDLPGTDQDEADLEGIYVLNDWLWVVGSHGLKRKNIKPGKSQADNAKRLRKLSLDANRRLLACIPIEINAAGEPVPMRQTRDGRMAMCLQGDVDNNQLTLELAKDDHLKPFLQIPSKDNGLDIEGLAGLSEQRILLGLRGPVLRGWATLLEVAVVPNAKVLTLSPLDDEGTLVRKHFLNLEGLGIRDLHWSGDDLLILAGPTMVLDADIRLFRWKDARQQLLKQSEPVRFEEDLVESITLPHQPGKDRAEAICCLPPEWLGAQEALLVLYDAPASDRLAPPHGVYGDVWVSGQKRS